MQSNWQDPPEYRGGGSGGMQFALPRLTPAVKTLLISNIGIFVLMVLLSDPTSPDGGGVFSGIRRLFWLSPAAWIDWFPFVPFWQLLTYGFLHDGFGHIIGNMLFLYFLGSMLEETVGTRRFAVFYGATVVLAGLAQLLLGFVTGSHLPILGASGGVLAIVTAMATLRPQTRIIFIIFPVTLKVVAIAYVAMDVFRLVQEAKGAENNVASFAHLTGALLGFLAVRKAWIWSDPLSKVQSWRAESEREREETDDRRLDDLLEKINREGLGSLNLRERAFLKRVSKRRQQ